MAPVINQSVAGGAVITTVTTPMSPSSPGVGGTFTIADNTGYPSGRQTVVIDRTETNEEKVLGSLSGTTFTVEQRGYDGTVASTHTAGQATCSEPLAAAIVTALINHVDGVEANPHSGVLLNNAAHDIEARHQFGAAYGNPVAPTTIQPDDAASAGTGDNPAKEDHKHAIVAASAVSVSGVNSEGVATSFARSDHTHDLGNGVITLGDINATDFGLMFPSGMTVFYPGTSDPFGWLICDGRAVSRTGATAALFAVCSTNFGVGDGSTTFNIPDLRGRYPFGKATSGTGSTIGATFGTVDHTHGLTTAVAAIDHIASGDTHSPHLLRRVAPSGWTANIMLQVGSQAQSDSTAFVNGTALIGPTDSANPPSVTGNWIIKT